MMRWLGRSVSRKLMLVALATTFLALLLTAIAMLAYEFQRFRDSHLTDLVTQAEILGKVSAPALEFDDANAAQENLAQLQTRPGIQAGALFGSDGRLFASYVRPGIPPVEFPAKPQRLESPFDKELIRVFVPILRGTEPVGTVYLLAEFPLYERLGAYARILIAAILGSLLLAGGLTFVLQRSVTLPIASMTETVREVIRTRNFSLRVKKTTDDEIGILVEAFDNMLDEIGERTGALEQSNVALTREMQVRSEAEAALQQLNETLEQRIRDRTAELEQAHEQLRQAQKMEALGQLTGGIAHDFNNLLAGMAGNMEMMKIRIGQGRAGELERYIDSALQSVDRATALTHRLLAFSRRQTLAPKQTDVSRLIASMEEMLRRTIGPEVQLETRLEEETWNVRCDQHQLENAILNLSINARDAMPRGGKLTITVMNGVPYNCAFARAAAATSQEHVTIIVMDNGSGMTSDVLARAFDPFFTTKPLGQGTGLGLSMVYGFVNQSGGQIGIQSEPSRGTIVYIHLPRSEGQKPTQEPAAVEAPSAPRAASAASILVVDDEQSVREVLKEMLDGLGYAVSAAADATEALQILRSSDRIDLLVTDVGLPGMNGSQLAKEVREISPTLPVLFITGYTHDAQVRDSLTGPGMEVMVKPFKLDEFGVRVAHMLQEKVA